MSGVLEFASANLSLIAANLAYATVEGWAFLLSKYGAGAIIGAEIATLIALQGPAKVGMIAVKTATALTIARGTLVFFHNNKDAPFRKGKQRQPKSIWDWNPTAQDDSGAWNILRQLVETLNALRETDQYGIGQLLSNPKLQGHELVSRLYYLYTSSSSSCYDDDKATTEAVVDDATLKGLKKYRYFAALPYEATDDETMTKALSKQGYDLISSQHSAAIVPYGSPAYFLAYNKDTKEVLLTVRGTFSPQDAFTDVLASGVEWAAADSDTNTSNACYVHSGIHNAAKFLVEKFGNVLESLHTAGNNITLVGHSLGAGVTSLMALRLKQEYNLKRMHCWAFCPPACMDLSLAQESSDCITSLVHDDDCVPRLAIGPFAALLQQLIEFDSWEDTAKEMGHPAGLSVLKHLERLFTWYQRNPSNHASSTDNEAKAAADDIKEQAAVYDPYVPGRIVLMTNKGERCEFKLLDATRYTIQPPLGCIGQVIQGIDQAVAQMRVGGLSGRTYILKVHQLSFERQLGLFPE